jgi:hypothetical protein
MNAGIATAPELVGAFARSCRCFSAEKLGEVRTKNARASTAADRATARIMRCSSIWGGNCSFVVGRVPLVHERARRSATFRSCRDRSSPAIMRNAPHSPRRYLCCVHLRSDRSAGAEPRGTHRNWCSGRGRRPGHRSASCHGSATCQPATDNQSAGPRHSAIRSEGGTGSRRW